MEASYHSYPLTNRHGHINFTACAVRLRVHVAWSRISIYLVKRVIKKKKKKHERTTAVYYTFQIRGNVNCASKIYGYAVTPHCIKLLYYANDLRIFPAKLAYVNGYNF